jgi:hypothetical protein
MPGAELRAARANRVFCTDEKRIRTENTVTVNGKNGVGFLYEIADCARMCFSSVRNRRSARSGFRPRNKRNPATTRGAQRQALFLFLVFLYQRIG